ncbi:hypothetical protein [Halostella litorea]|uniref:hypothetical protein n=1 Tax=Halostella litorea TaxID=2528831 RepID=UPI00109320E3|nr:hypothetical protein [Halostella litorea]
MPSGTDETLVAAARLLLVGAGVAVAALTVEALVTMPPPPPDSDGFAHGMAAIFGSVVIVLSLGVAAVGVVLPTVLGRDDRLGFGRRQRLALKGAAVLIGGGLVAALAVGAVGGLQYGILLWLGLVVLAVLVVGATLVWRAVEAVVRFVSRRVTADAP